MRRAGRLELEQGWSWRRGGGLDQGLELELELELELDLEVVEVEVEVEIRGVDKRRRRTD